MPQTHTDLLRELSGISEVFAHEIEQMKETAERVVQHAIYSNIHPIMEKMTKQAIEGQFPQQKEFLKRVVPESKAVDHDRAVQSFNIQINVSEFKRDE